MSESLRPRIHGVPLCTISSVEPDTAPARFASMDPSSPAHPTVSPYLVVADASALIAFAQSGFGADLVDHQTRPDGTVAAAALRVGDSVIMLTERGDATNAPRLHVYVADVEASYRRTLSHGASSLSAPESISNAALRAGVIGPAGVQWWMSTAPDGIEAV